MDTGIALLDAIVSRVARDDAEGPGISRWLLRKAMS